jgi:hypothetical protein
VPASGCHLAQLPHPPAQGFPLVGGHGFPAAAICIQLLARRGREFSQLIEILPKRPLLLGFEAAKGSQVLAQKFALPGVNLPQSLAEGTAFFANVLLHLIA